ncbi:MAG: DUF4340 domain-containing protein [Treponema sp.]|jgi:hypothetical protein|nr:DUF4340 domain-containing protein [Treponema sp.]
MDTSNRYNRSIMLLSGVAGVLVLIYAGTLIFDPEQMNARKGSFRLLEPAWAEQADRIELSSSGAEEKVILIQKDKVWFVSRDNTEYPAKQLRIEDFLTMLSAKGNYPVRGTAAASHERLGLTADTASRIVIRGGPATYPLLDVLLGKEDSTGQEIYLRKNGETEVRSVEDRLSSYVDSPQTSWFDLRLFPKERRPELTIKSVQRVTVNAPSSEPFVLTRHEGSWTITGAAGINIDNQQVESYIRAVLEAEAEDFFASQDPQPPHEGQILLELGTGQTLAVKVSPVLGSNQRGAEVEGSPYRYVLAEWTLTRLFRDSSYFERQ